MRKAIDRTGRGPVLQVQVGVGGFGIAQLPAAGGEDAMPLVLGRQAHRLAALLRLPAAEGARLQAVDFHRPVPGHGHFLRHQAQTPAVLPLHPECRVHGPGEVAPAPALVVPEGIVRVAAGGDELQKLAIAHQQAAGLKGRHIGRVLTVFVVPAVAFAIEGFAQGDAAGGHVHQRVARRLARVRAHGPVGLWPHAVQPLLADQHRGGLQVDALVLHAHHDGPPGVVPVHGQRQRGAVDQAHDQRAHAVAVGLHARHAGPVVMRLVQVVPAHLVHADGEHRFELRVDALADQAREQQLVDEEGGRVAVVKNQWVAQRDGPLGPGRVARQGAKQRLVGVEGLHEVLAQALAKFLRVAGVQGQAPRQRDEGLRRSQEGGVNAVHRWAQIFLSSIPAG